MWCDGGWKMGDAAAGLWRCGRLNGDGGSGRWGGAVVAGVAGSVRFRWGGRRQGGDSAAVGYGNVSDGDSCAVRGTVFHLRQSRACRKYAVGTDILLGSPEIFLQKFPTRAAVGGVFWGTKAQ